MTNTLSTKTLRDKYRSSQVQLALMNNLVAEKVCLVDRTELYTISSPYLSTSVTATVQALAGTYTPGAVTTLTDTLTVADEVVAPTHIFDFEAVMANFDLFYMAHQAITNAMVMAIDKFVINELCEGGTEVSVSAAGGLTTSGNVITIISKIISYCAGYADPMGGLYLIVENTDLTGILPAAVSYGFSFADQVLANGRVAQIMGVDIYVVRDSTYIDATNTAASGSKTWTNSAHRVGGVKNVTTYASPRGLKFEEKDRTGYTGKEVVGIGYIGFKQWTPWAGLTMDMTFV